MGRHSSIKDYITSIRLGDKKLAPVGLSRIYYRKGYYGCNGNSVSILHCKGAIKYLDKAISLHPASKYHRIRSTYKFLLKDYKGALKDIGFAIKTADKSEVQYPHYYFAEKGFIQFKLGDFSAGAISTVKAYELWPIDKKSGKRPPRFILFGKKYKWEDILNSISEKKNELIVISE